MHTDKSAKQFKFKIMCGAHRHYDAHRKAIPFWKNSMRAAAFFSYLSCGPLLRIDLILSNRLAIHGCAVWNMLRFPRLIPISV